MKRRTTGAAVCALVAAVALAVGCATKPRASLAVPAAPAEPPAAGLRVSLVWSERVDLDLYVTDPALETVYFANPRSQSGGVLQSDVACADLGPSVGAVTVERAEWQQPRPGRYRIGVDFPEDCGNAVGEVGYRLVVERAGRREERSGTVRRVIFEPIAFEFDLPGQ